MLLQLDQLGYVNWVSSVRQLLQNNGFNFVWINQYVVNERLFLYQLTERLKDIYIQKWFGTLESSAKLIVYKNVKSNYERETYCDVLLLRKYRHAYAQFRSGVHMLELER